jgi:predicted peroxiredoxin
MKGPIPPCLTLFVVMFDLVSLSMRVVMKEVSHPNVLRLMHVIPNITEEGNEMIMAFERPVAHDFHPSQVPI